MMAKEGFLCSDIGKTAANDVKSCKEAGDVIQKINPDVDISATIVEKDMPGHPKGCFIKDDTIYFNRASDDTPSEESRQVCKGIYLSHNLFRKQNFFK